MKRTHATQLRDGLKTLGLATIRECYRDRNVEGRAAAA